MPHNDVLVPEMRASLDRMTAEITGESREDLLKDYVYSISSGRPISELDETEKRAIDAYRKHI